MPVTVTLSGEGIEFERDVSEKTAVNIMQLSISDGEGEEIVADTDAPDVDTESLPDDFFTRLSSKQKAMLRVLVAAEEPLTSTELRRRMNEQYGVETSGGRALAGILAGLTRKYGDGFELVSIKWGNNEGIYQLNPDRTGYIEEIEAQFLD